MTDAQRNFLARHKALDDAFTRDEASSAITKIITRFKSGDISPPAPFFVQHVGRARRPMHPSNRLWNPGDPITDLNELEFQISKRRYVFVKGRSAGYHWSFVANWQFGRVVKMIREGTLLRGIRNPDKPYEFTARWCEAVPHATVKSCYMAECYDCGAHCIQAHTKGVIMKKCREAARQFLGHNEFKLTVAFNDEGKIA